MRRLCVSIVLLAFLVAAAVAYGELEQSGNLRLTINGGFKPHALPRTEPAPVTANLEASITTVDGSRPPLLRRISFAINRYGLLSTRGLPTCDTGQLEATTTEEALSRCRAARVGHGRFGANVDFPNRAPLPVEGKMLAFNARIDGRPGLLLHIYGSNPVQATFVLEFKISHPAKGTFGTVFATVIPKIASDLGYVTDVTLTFGRRYSFKGKSMSFLSARCAAPAGFPGALFSFARASFGFATGRQLTTTLARDCLVR
jgi:hypothetical protein